MPSTTGKRPVRPDDSASKTIKGIWARNDAMWVLADRHRDEFEDLHTKNRVSVGLTPRSSGPTKEELEERIRRQRDRLERWEAELRLTEEGGPA